MRRNYEKKFLQSILDQYEGLGEIKVFFLYISGFENSNFFVETEKGEFVIKIFEGESLRPENIFYELEVMDFSFKAGIKTPRILRNKADKLATVVKGKFACIMDCIAGENMDKRILSNELVAEAGEQAGKMDLALKHFKDEKMTRQDYEWDLKSALVLEKSLNLLPKKFEQKIFEQIFKEFRQIYSRFIAMPAGLIHNDIVPHNWLVQDGKLNGIIDFSDMEFSPYIQNVAVALHLVCFGYNYNPGQAKIFIESYRRFNPLSKNEISLLYILIKVRFVSFVVGFNCLNVEYGSDQQRLEAVNDHYEFLKRFIGMGQEEFDRMIGA